MKTKNKKEYQDWFDKNSNDSYGKRCFTYAEDWANMMEKHLKEGKLLNHKVIEDFGNDADTDGITGFMYTASKSILKNYWVYSNYIEYYLYDITPERKKQIEREWKIKRILK